MSAPLGSPQDERNPNLFKNRLPTESERKHLQRLLDKESNEMSHLKTEINALMIEIASTRDSIVESEEALRVMKGLNMCADITLKASNQTDHIMEELRHQNLLSPLNGVHRPPEGPYKRALEEMNSMAKYTTQQITRGTGDDERINKGIKELELELEALRSCLGFSRASLSTFKECLTKLKESVRSKKELLGARRRLPAEIWEQIFNYRVLQDELAYEVTDRAKKPPYSALKLTAVCRYWREVAQGQPQLWQYVAIPCTSMVSFSQWSRIGHYATLSKNLKPTVYVSPSTKGEEDANRQIGDVLKSLWSHFAVLELRPSAQQSNIDQLLQTLNPVIDELRIFGSWSTSAGLIIPLSAGSLERVNSIVYRYIRPRLIAPRPQASVVSAKFADSTFYFQELATVLRDLPQVRTVEFHAIYTYKFYREFDTSITLPNITTITAHIHVLVSFLCEKVIVPNLRSVRIQGIQSLSQKYPTLNWRSFISLHQRRQTIKVLTLDGLPFVLGSKMNASYCAEIVEELPNLEELAIFYHAAPLTIEGLVKKGLVPKGLRKLSIMSPEVTEIQLAPLLKLHHDQTQLRLDLSLNNQPIPPENQVLIRQMLISEQDQTSTIDSWPRNLVYSYIFYNTSELNETLPHSIYN